MKDSMEEAVDITSWVDKCSISPTKPKSTEEKQKITGQKIERSRPPIFDFDSFRKQSSKKSYSNVKEELKSEFDEAGNWVGICLEMEELRKFVWCEFCKQESDQTLVNAHRYDKS